MTGEEKGSVAISGRSSHKMTGLSGLFYAKDLWLFVHLVVLTPTVTGYKEVSSFKLGVSNVSGTE